jgi:hypothetical protein
MKKKSNVPALDLHHPALRNRGRIFIDNRYDSTLDVAVVGHLEALRANQTFPWGLSIASAFFDIPGFQRVADALEQVAAFAYGSAAVTRRMP